MYPITVRNCLGPEHGMFSIAIDDLILRSALLGFSLLRTSYYYEIKGLVCYVYSVYNTYSYGELSVYVSLILSQDTPAEVHFLLMYLNLQQICHFISFHH